MTPFNSLCVCTGYNIIINNSNNNNIIVRMAAIIMICMNKKGIPFLNLHIFFILKLILHFSRQISKVSLLKDAFRHPNKNIVSAFTLLVILIFFAVVKDAINSLNVFSVRCL